MGIELRSIGLQNFQTIGGYQEIPFGKITFLYGPNSAGKSAIRDALETMLELWGASKQEGSPFDPVSGDSNENLLRNIRRVNRRAVVGGTMLCAEALITKDSEGNWDVYHEIKGSYDIRKYIDSRESLKIRGGVRSGQGSGGIVDELFLGLDDELLIHWNHCDQKIGINLGHPLIKFLGFIPGGDNPRLSDAIELAEKNEAGFLIEQDWLISNKADLYYDGDRKVNFFRSYDLINIQHGDEAEGGSEELADKIYDGILDVGGVYNECIEIFSNILFCGLKSELVKGSRDIPSDEDLTYLVSPHEIHKDHAKWSRNLERTYGFSLKSNPLYAHLAIASALRVIRSNATIAGLDEHSIGMMDIFMERALENTYLRPFDFINEALRDYLFADKLYQMISDVTFLQDIDQYYDKKVDHGFYGVGPLLVRLRLIDATGNILRFDQVGSGIGYVLPILMGVYSSLYSSKLAVLEQPELHLHPALQSSLCDVFIDACNKGTRLVIESHSEHILLRALRRVRETSSGKLKTPSLSLNSDDIVVLYFDPNLNGETKVKRLRVADNGDFLDRWPNGFFCERDQDLFDE
jgi:AAA ATPase domain